jgi:hypothetical protein
MRIIIIAATWKTMAMKENMEIDKIPREETQIHNLFMNQKRTTGRSHIMGQIKGHSIMVVAETGIIPKTTIQKIITIVELMNPG